MGAKHSRHNLTSSEQYRRGSVQQQQQQQQQQTATMNSMSRSANSITIDGRQYHSDTVSGIYMLPRDEVEQDRLNSQHFALKALYEGNVLKCVEDRLPEDAIVLDIGCGSGSWVMEMAVDHPQYKVIGSDVSDMFPTTIRPENVQFELYNVIQGLPYPDNTFDLVHMRLLITALGQADWTFVIAEIFRVLKPGGLVELVESDFTDKSDNSIVESFNQEFIKALEEGGQDPHIAPKLTTLLSEAKFEIIEVNNKFIDYSLPLNPIAREMLSNWKNALLSIKPMLAHRFSSDVEMFPTIVDRYIEGVAQAGWKVKMWAICGQKPAEENQSNNQAESS
ncbi:Demethylmenaquinone methyltransferase [Choanephora cucurbitarum]|uniref:Demethylmenaquinone methyltransferase n=1 Tax=Choanephora cucurbitarum TaxID=101091 RepID=A0A1C7N239_9FUNG|nr:Demethylmenaquinone methyltransferase [Choanephora cucurbitarum]